MIRNILAVIAGYATMVVGTMIGFTILYLVLGQDRTFVPGTVRTTPAWDSGALAMSLAIALLGGLVCAVVARPPKRPTVLVLGLVVVVLGLLSAFMNLQKPEPGEVPPDISVMEAAAMARQPAWYAFALPFVGFVGVVIGGELVARRTSPPAPAP